MIENILAEISFHVPFFTLLTVQLIILLFSKHCFEQRFAAFAAVSV